MEEIFFSGIESCEYFIMIVSLVRITERFKVLVIFMCFLFYSRIFCIFIVSIFLYVYIEYLVFGGFYFKDCEFREKYDIFMLLKV